MHRQRENAFVVGVETTMATTEKKLSSTDIKEAVRASVKAESFDAKLWGMLPNSVRTVWGPLFLVAVPPYFVVLFWHILDVLEGDVTQLVKNIMENGPGYLITIVPSPVDPEAWKLIGLFGCVISPFSLCFTKIVLVVSLEDFLVLNMLDSPGALKVLHAEAEGYRVASFEGVLESGLL